jgi:drug/metabolite transporter (DMT)-like permease
VLEGFGQICFKISVASPRRRRWIAIGVGLAVSEVVVYTTALRFLDVSTAFPIGSLSFVTVTLLSGWVLGEVVTKTRWTGIGLIIAGTALIAAPA